MLDIFNKENDSTELLLTLLSELKVVEKKMNDYGRLKEMTMKSLNCYILANFDKLLKITLMPKFICSLKSLFLIEKK